MILSEVKNTLVFQGCIYKFSRSENGLKVLFNTSKDQKVCQCGTLVKSFFVNFEIFYNHLKILNKKKCLKLNFH